MSDEMTTCSQCKKPVDATVSASAPGKPATPPICLKCWEANIEARLGFKMPKRRRAK